MATSKRPARSSARHRPAMVDMAEASSKAIPVDGLSLLAEAHRLAHAAEHELTHAVPKLASAGVHAYPSAHE